jgi:RNA polymerase sigma-70 factor (ECF subfamily)
MNADPLEAVLAKLSEGDTEAAAAVFRTYEPILRMVVRRQISDRLRAKFDSVDIVQSIWVDFLRGFQDVGWRFENAAHLRAFLVTMTRNRFIDRLRQNRHALAHQQVLGSAAGAETDQASPSEFAAAGELWERLLHLCRPAHRPVLELKRQGLPLAEIAERTGLHPSSVRRILYDLARRLAQEQRGPDESKAQETVASPDTARR